MFHYIFTAMKYATLERDINESADWFKLRKLTKEADGTISEVMRVRLDALNCDFFTSAKNGKRYASLHGDNIPTVDATADEWLQVSN